MGNFIVKLSIYGEIYNQLNCHFKGTNATSPVHIGLAQQELFMGV